MQYLLEHIRNIVVSKANTKSYVKQFKINGNIIITGASSPLGIEFVNLLQTKEREIISLGRTKVDGTKHYQTNLCDLEMLRKRIRTILERYKIDMVINNAAITPLLSEGICNSDIVNVNYEAPMLIMKTISEVNTHKTIFLNISSSAGSRGKRYVNKDITKLSAYQTYSLSKYLLNQGTSSFAIKYERHKYYAIHPGFLKKSDNKMETIPRKITFKILNPFLLDNKSAARLILERVFI